MKQWSRQYAQCQKCGTTELKHEGLGLCVHCYTITKYKTLKSDKSFVCKNCAVTFATHYVVGKRILTFCSKSCKSTYESKLRLYPMNFKTCKFESKEQLEQEIQNVIRTQNKYVSSREILKIVKISGQLLKKYKVSITEQNKILGFDRGYSIFETRVFEILENIFKKIKREKSFINCLSPKGKKLRFDFYIESANLLVEADGEQHSKKDDYFEFRKSTNFEYLQQCDKIKNEFAKNNNFILIRIPYTGVVTKDYVLKYLFQNSILEKEIHNQQPSLERNLLVGSENRGSLNLNQHNVEKHGDNTHLEKEILLGTPGVEIC